MNLSKIKFILLNAKKDKHISGVDDQTVFNKLYQFISQRAVLSEADFEAIRDLFLSRFRRIFLTTQDLQFRSYVNQYYWIPLAKLIAELRPGVSASPTYFLYPTATNSIDYNSFEPLRNKPDLTRFFLSDDRSVVYDAWDFLANCLRHDFQLALYRSTNRLRQSAVTVEEMAQVLQCQFVESPLVFGKVKYTSASDLMNSVIYPQLQRKGELQPHLLRSLLGLMQCYMELKDVPDAYRQFQEQFGKWLQKLYHDNIDNIGHLYACSILHSGRSMRCIDLLIQLRLMDGFVNAQLVLDISYWILSIYPDLVNQANCFLELRRLLKLAEFFDQTQLYQLIADLDCESDSELQTLKRESLNQVSAQMADWMPSLQNLFERRWHKVMRTEKDYTRKQTGINLAWIRLAQFLKAAELIKIDHYRLLMPTHQSDQHDLTLASISDYPLSYYIVSDKGSLIFLLDCARQFKVTHAFAYWVDIQPMALSPHELERVQYASPRFHRYLNILAREAQIPPISATTVRKLKEIAAGLFHSRGLIANQTLSVNEYHQTCDAYHDLMRFLRHLPMTERSALMRQNMTVHATNKSFAELLSDLEQFEDDRGCASVASLYLIYLVKSYMPFLKFSSEIEGHDRVREICRTVPRRLVSEYDGLSEEEARQFCFAILQSLLALQSELSLLSGKDWSLWDKHYCLPAPAIIVANLIKDQLCTATPDFRYTYMQIHESVLKPYRPTSGLFSFFYNDNQLFEAWVRNSLTNPKPAILLSWYKPEAIIASVLTHYDKRQPSQSQQFDLLLRIYLQPNSPALIEWRMNCWFQEMLQSQDRVIQGRLRETARAQPNLVQVKLQLNDFWQTKGLALKEVAPDCSLSDFIKGRLAGSNVLHQLERRIPTWSELYAQRDSNSQPSYLY